MVEIGRPSLLSQTYVFWWNASGSCVKNNSALFNLMSANMSVRHQRAPKKCLNTELCPVVEEEIRSFNVVVLEAAICGALKLKCVTLTGVSEIQEVSQNWGRKLRERKSEIIEEKFKNLTNYIANGIKPIYLNRMMTDT